MIIKFLSKKSTSAPTALIKYLFNYVLNEEKINKNDLLMEDLGKPKGKFIVKHNIRARTIQGFIREFNKNETYRLVHRKDSVKVFHTIISFSPKDRDLLNDEILKDIGKKFIEERGSANLYIGTKHEDKKHLHLHFCSSGTRLDGRSARISNQKFNSIKLEMDRYQREKYPFLINSLPEHGKTKRLTKEALVESFKANRQNNKAALLEKLEQLYSRAASRDDFLAQIKAIGHEPYFRGDKLQGILFEGKTKYRFSRLGFDQERLEAIGKNKTIYNGLEELATFRQKQPQKNVPRQEKLLNQQPIKDTENQELKTQLEELSLIRSRGQTLEREKGDEFERVRNLNGESDDNFSEEGYQPSLFPSEIPLFSKQKISKQI